ncbi:hypothetical protein D3C87_1270170 [compost metagenome]
MFFGQATHRVDQIGRGETLDGREVGHGASGRAAGQLFANLLEDLASDVDGQLHRVTAFEDDLRRQAAHLLKNAAVTHGHPGQQRPQRRHHDLETVLVPEEQLFDLAARNLLAEQLEEPLRRQILLHRPVVEAHRAVDVLVEQRSLQ